MCGCHSTDGSRLVGPSYKGGSTREFESGPGVIADENYIRKSILQPTAQVVKGYPPAMPSYQGQLSDDEINALIEYIKPLNRRGNMSTATASHTDNYLNHEKGSGPGSLRSIINGSHVLDL
ncbi:cytochrome C [Leptospira interrogans str. 2002000624]|nr:cytochrome C [Leptospira interrogans str. 2002000624]